MISVDTETWPIEAGALAPKLVCYSAFDGESQILEHRDNKVRLRKILESGELIVFHNAAFDLAVIKNTYPDFLPLVFELLDNHLVADTLIREKIAMIEQWGDSEYIRGKSREKVKRVKYSLDALVWKYLGQDISQSKEDPNSWRLRFHELDEVPLEDWPEEAKDYALGDAIYTYHVYNKQSELYTNTALEPHRVKFDFALLLMSERGFKIDLEARDKLLEELSPKVDLNNCHAMIEAGIVNPGEEPRPKLRGTGFTQGKAPSLSMKATQALIVEICDKHRIKIERTPKGRVATGKDFLEKIKNLHPAIQELCDRKEVEKIVGTDLPNMSAEICHPCYDSFKSTGRTSCYINKLYPSLLIQTMDPRVRHCIVPRKGTKLFDIDYASLELVTLAARLDKVCENKTLRNILREGKDPHAHFGSRLAFHFDSDFANAVNGQSRYDFFTSLKETQPEFYKDWRNYAKPANLGLPGGLGPDTFVKYSAGVGVFMTRDEACIIREAYMEEFPEIKEYFNWIDTQRDPEAPEYYRYTTPLGMVRGYVTFSEIANGYGLQSPAAEGALTAAYNLVRECSIGSLKGKAFPIGFIHDQIVGEVLDGPETSQIVDKICKIMVDSMASICENIVPVKVEAKVLDCWTK